MALDDQNMQFLQGQVQSHCEKGDESVIYNESTGEYYKVINKQSGTTQAIAVAPCDANGKNVDYDQTAVVVYGTQPGINESTGNALKAFGGMTPQYQDVEDFYTETNKIVNKGNRDGEITNMSGYSQSGPAVAKVAANHRVGKVTNFCDWGAEAAVGDGESQLSQEDIDYLNKHCTVYTDSGKDLTWLNRGGDIPYGKKVVAEGSNDINPIGDHDYRYFHIKGNGPDISWYVKHNKFCSGMTEEQVEKIAEHNAEIDVKAHVGRDRHSKEDYKQRYIREYKKTYGSYAKPKKPTKSKTSKKTSVESAVMKRFGKDGKGLSLKDLTQRFKSAKGAQRIVLRKALLMLGAASLSAEVAELATKVQELMEESRNDIRDLVESARSKAFDIAEELSDGEVESLLAEIEFSCVWNEGMADENEAQAKSFASQVDSLSGHIESAGSAIEGADAGQAAEIDGFNSGLVELL